MNKYRFHFNYYATADVEILANSIEEAIDKVDKITVPNEEFHYTLNERSVIEQTEVPDLSALIKQAEDILKANDAFQLDPWPFATLQIWNGEDTVGRTEPIESIYWDEELEEIGFETEHWSGYSILDLPEIQQLNICLAIIKQAE